MGRPYRSIWLPALAILLPCAFVGVLGYKWIALEREAVEHRSVEAAKAAAAALARDLKSDVTAAGDAAARGLEEVLAARPPFQPLPAHPPLVAEAYLFDSSSRLLSPDDDARARRGVEEHRLAAADPAWRRLIDRVHNLEARGRIDEALRTGTDLLDRARVPSLRAAALLALARLSHTAGRREAAERYVSQILSCCPDARDEYGTSFVLYAAWQRAAWDATSLVAGETLEALARDLEALVDRGYLGRPEDVSAMSLLAQKVNGSVRQQLTDLAQRIERIRAAALRRIESGRLAAKWLAGVDVAGPLPILSAFRRDGSPSMIAVSRTGSGRLVVIVLDMKALAARIAAWGAAHTSFEMTLADPAGAAATPGVVLAAPLFAQTTGFDLVVRQRGSDPATDRRRERLFVTAIAGALTLTLLIGYLAVRDMIREIGTAALRSTFIVGVTHELKTPLASIRLLAETLREGRARPETSRELLDAIVEESDRLARLVDNVLASSRIESGARVYHPRPISLSETVRSAIRRFDYVIRQEGFTLAQQFDHGDLHVAADPEALERTVLNLLGNAVKYSGPVRQISVTVGRRNGRAEVSVADNGIGLPRAEQARIFDPFYRSPAAAAQTAGAGLGLSLARHFADAHGGRLTVHSQPGRGSVFSLSLPLCDRGSGAAASATDHGADSDR